MKVSRTRAKKALTSLKAFLDALPDEPMSRKKGKSPMPQRTPKKARPAKAADAATSWLVSIDSPDVTRLIHLSDRLLDRWLSDLKVRRRASLSYRTGLIRMIQGTPVSAFLALSKRKLRAMVADLGLGARKMDTSIEDLVNQIQNNI